MQYVMIAEGNTLDGIRALESPDVAGQFNEGDESLLEINFRWEIAANAAAGISQWLTDHNFSPQPWSVDTRGSTLLIRATAGAWPLFGLVVVAIGIILAVSLFNWTFYKLVREVHEAAGGLGVTLLIGAAAIIAILVLTGDG